MFLKMGTTKFFSKITQDNLDCDLMIYSTHFDAIYKGIQGPHFDRHHFIKLPCQFFFTQKVLMCNYLYLIPSIEPMIKELSWW